MSPNSKRAKKSGKFEMHIGSYVDSKGYPQISAGPLRGMRIHILVAIAKFGYNAVMAKDVIVHHKDDNKQNPHPDNLELKTESEHNSVSAKQYWFLKQHVWPQEREAWESYMNNETPQFHEMH